MPVPLHKNCADRLVALLTDALVSVRIDNRIFVDYSSTSSLRAIDAVLPTSGKPKQQLDSIFEDDERLRAFTIDWISRKLKDSQIYESGVNGEFLSSLAGFGDSSEIARNIVADFVALPYDYIVSLPLPASFDQLASSLADSKRANPRVHKIDEDFRAKFRPSDAVSEKEPNPFGSIFAVMQPRMPEDGVCL